MKQNKYFYPARFKWEDEKVLVSFIDFNNIFTYGDNFEDAYYMAQDVLYNTLPEYQNNLPNPTLDYMRFDVDKNEIITIVELVLIICKTAEIYLMQAAANAIILPK